MRFVADSNYGRPKCRKSEWQTNVLKMKAKIVKEISFLSNVRLNIKNKKNA